MEKQVTCFATGGNHNNTNHIIRQLKKNAYIKCCYVINTHTAKEEVEAPVLQGNLCQTAFCGNFCPIAIRPIRYLSSNHTV